MKRIGICLLLACLLCAALPALAAEYYGSMEVVNCEHWVSLREKPNTGAKRLARVSLGALVSDAQEHDEKWMYVQHDGKRGYILSEYLAPSASGSANSAMLVSGTQRGAAFYSAADRQHLLGYIPENAIVRGAIPYGEDMVYVEYAGRCGFVSAAEVTAYGEVETYPEQMTLTSATQAQGDEMSVFGLMASWAKGFPQGPFESYVQPDMGAPRAKFVLEADETLLNVQLLDVSLSEFTDGAAIYDVQLAYTLPKLNTVNSLLVSTVLDGAVPNLAVCYMDDMGEYYFVFVQISGEDGSLILTPF